MKNNPRVLFITEKWCDANPQLGLTNNYHNLFNSFKNTFPQIHFDIIHIDEFSLLKKKHIDTFIPTVLERAAPDVVIFSLLGKSHLNPTDASYNAIRQSNCKTVFMWPDMFDGWGIPQIKELNSKKYADLHVCWGSERNVDADCNNLLWLWAPQDKTLYHTASPDDKSIDVSFLGSPRYAERQRYLSFLLKSDINAFIGAGQRERRISAPEYASLMRQSKISLNFPEGPDGYDQCKGRVWEILASGCLLMERANEATRNYLTPDVHYVEFKDEADLSKKIKYYLENEKEREYIARRGNEIYNSKFNAEVFWKTVTTELGL